MSELILREAEQGDVKAMAVLDRQCFADPWSERSFRQEIEENKAAYYLVAVLDGAVVGYVGIWQILDEGHITNVAVHPACRRQGIGRILLEQLIQVTESNGVVCHTLEVRPSNTGALALYGGFGFREEGRRVQYYEDNGEDALILWRYSLQYKE